MRKSIRLAALTSVTAFGLAFILVSAAAARGVRASAVQSVGGGGAAGARYGVGHGAYADTAAVSNPNLGHNAAVYGQNIGRRPMGDVDIRRDVPVDPDYGCCYDDHPVAKAAIVGATVASAAAIGSLYYELPAGCSTIEVEGYVYERCGEVWYEPHLSEYESYYIVVNPPQ